MREVEWEFRYISRSSSVIEDRIEIRLGVSEERYVSGFSFRQESRDDGVARVIQIMIRDLWEDYHA